MLAQPSQPAGDGPNLGVPALIAGQDSPPDPMVKITGRAPAVRGHRAFWADGALVWQYTHGGWAWLRLPYPWDFAKLPKTIERGTVKPGITRASIKRERGNVMAPNGIEQRGIIEGSELLHRGQCHQIDPLQILAPVD